MQFATLFCICSLFKLLELLERLAKEPLKVYGNFEPKLINQLRINNFERESLKLVLEIRRCERKKAIFFNFTNESIFLSFFSFKVHVPCKKRFLV